jgi:hypothetical protein
LLAVPQYISLWYKQTTFKPDITKNNGNGIAAKMYLALLQILEANPKYVWGTVNYSGVQ